MRDSWKKLDDSELDVLWQKLLKIFYFFVCRKFRFNSSNVNDSA